MSEKQSGFEVQESQRQSWLSIAAVWAGGMICVPCLMIGGVLSGGGLSLAEIVISILIGYGLICVYMIFIGMQACDTGLPVAVMASGALGEKGARYVISTLIAIACIGWFGIQSATCGQAFASMVAPLLGMEASTGFVAVCSIIWGVIIAAYWITGRGKKENFSFKKGVSAAGLISFIVGALVACITGGTFASFPGLVEALPFLNWPFFVGPVNGIVVSLVLYVVFAGVSPKKAD